MIRDLDKSPGTGGRIIPFNGGVAHLWPIDGPINHAIVCYTNGTVTSLFVALADPDATPFNPPREVT
jgi:hypothetical protein